MKRNSLDHFIKEIKKVWGLLSTETVSSSRKLMTELAKTPPEEEWLSKLLIKSEINEVLYRDPDQGFMLLAHSEKKDLYRIPHDHGRCWVIYAVQSGEMEMKTYKPMTDEDGKLDLVCRETYRLRAGESKAYLPGDVHATKCISESVLMLRLTSCDLKGESRDGKMNRYVEK
jgi:hypothetical protein